MLSKLISISSLHQILGEKNLSDYESIHEWTFNEPETVLNLLKSEPDLNTVLAELQQRDGINQTIGDILIDGLDWNAAGTERLPVESRQSYISFLKDKFQGQYEQLEPLLLNKANKKFAHVIKLATFFNRETTDTFFSDPIFQKMLQDAVVTEIPSLVTIYNERREAVLNKDPDFLKREGTLLEETITIQTALDKFEHAYAVKRAAEATS